MVDITDIPFIIIAAELMLQHIRVFAVTITDHQEAVFQINLVDVFQIGIGLDIGAAVGGDDTTWKACLHHRIFRSNIFHIQRQSALSASFDNKYKIDIHQIIGAVSQIIENDADICMFTNSGIAITVQYNLLQIPTAAVGKFSRFQ